MADLRDEILEIISDIRLHVELQTALGVREMESSSLASEAFGSGVVIAMNERMGQAFSETLDEIRADIGECKRCKLHTGRKNIVFGEGNPHAALVFVGEGPGYEEDQQGRPFVGDAGQLLTKIIEGGMKLKRSDVYICNIVKCRPPGNRTPQPDEIEACKPFVMRQIEAIKPRAIVTLGNVPTQTLLNTKEGITKLRGGWRIYKDIPLMPTFHPAYLLRNPADKRLVWDDIQKVMAELEKTSGSDV